MRERFVDTAKNISIVLGALAMIYSVAWTLGIAPITNSRATAMINEAVQEQNVKIQDKLIDLEDKIEIWVDRTQKIGESIGSIDERTKNNFNTNNQILQELRSIRQEIRRQ